MGFTLRLILACDSCGREEDCGEDMADTPYGDIKLPEGWKTGDGPDMHCAHICYTCIEGAANA